MEMVNWVFERLWFSWLIDFSRYLLGAGSVYFLVWVLLKKPLASRKIRTKTPKLRQMVTEFKMSMLTVFIYGIVGFLTFFGAEAGLIEFYSDADLYGAGYYWFTVILMIVAHDAYFYWTHRAMHLPGVMKHIHGEHHKSINPTPWTAYRFDVFEAASHALFVPLFLLFVPMHGSAIVVFLLHMIFRNAIGHSGYELFPRSWAIHPILGWINLVTHHDMHHANGQYNFGLYFTWWDRLMGTEHPEYLARVTGNPDAVRRRLFGREEGANA